MITPSVHHIENTAHSVLARSEFRGNGESWLQRIISDITHWLNRTFSFSIGGFGASGSIVLAVIVVGLVGLVAALLFRYAYRNRKLKVHSVDPVNQSVVPTGPEFWLAEATYAEERSDWVEALRCRYRAAVALLSAKGIVDERLGHTSGEYRTRVGAELPEAFTPFSMLTESFEDAWYAGVSVGEDNSRIASELYCTVEAVACK
ncbi:MAG TPA: DUF4129 domain-containing protein [Acidimicrobiales bacterium]|nr:DUF4129 domain-containing protein [Acidimicrobiales bacterium]